MKTNIEKKSDQGKKASRISVIAITFCIFSDFFFVGPFRILDAMRYVPSEIGDSQKLGFTLQSVPIK